MSTSNDNAQVPAPPLRPGRGRVRRTADATHVARAGLLLGAWAVLMSAHAAAPGAVRAGDDSRALAQRIDERVQAAWEAQGVVPAPPAEDAEFLRRVSLDVVGKVPLVSEVRGFLADASPEKRRRLVDELLEGPNYIVHFSTVWRKVMVPEASADPQVRFLLPGFEAWLRERLRENTAYDEMVREILTTPLESADQRDVVQRAAEANPFAYFQAKRIAPDELAAATSRAFLGIRIECAQCHDHPFDAWKQEQFWSYAAFFAGIERPGDGLFAGVRELFDRREMEVPGTGTVVQAAYLNGTAPRWRFRVDSRETLAEWMTSRKNPYFARAAVNRVWGHFFGIGIVDPVDDFSDANPPSHPELLDELAREFAARDFDLKFLIRAITGSRTYQLSSRRTHESQDRPRRYARMPLKGLSPEQLFDSLAQATGLHQPWNPQQAYSFGGGTPRQEFLELFANDADPPTERSTSVLQALALMNGRFIADATSLERSATLSAIVEFPLMDTTERIETLYLAALSRTPRSDELELLIPYVESGGPGGTPGQALGDVFWSLLNSSEFLFNH